MKRALLYDPDKPRKQKREKNFTWLPVLYRNGQFHKLDGRSRESALLNITNEALLNQLGQKLSAAERLLIERLSWLHLCITLLDRRVLSGDVDVDESVQYSSHIDSFSRGLINLGLIGGVALPTLSDDTKDYPSTHDASETRLRKRETRESVETDI